MGRAPLASERSERRMDLKETWAAALGELQIGLTKANFDTWFKETSVVSEEDDVFCIGVPNAFAREWLENKYRGQVRQALQHIVGRTVDVKFITAPATAASSRASAGMRPSIPAAARAPPARAERRGAFGRPERPLHVLDLRGGLQQPPRACRGAVRGRAAGPLLQPAIHLRRQR